MRRAAALGALAAALAGCAMGGGFSEPETSAPPPARSDQRCAAPSVDLGDGRVAVPTCGAYRECALYRWRGTEGAISTALPFMLSLDGTPTQDYPVSPGCFGSPAEPVRATTRRSAAS